MFVKVVLKRFLPFCLAATCGVAVYWIDSTAPLAPSAQKPVTVFDIGHGTGSSGPDDTDSFNAGNHAPGSTVRFKILSKPRASYTSEARENNVEGTVLLKVALLASGQIGSITPVRTLPYGLTEQAIAAARQIKFKPKIDNGRPISTIVTMEYSFTIY